MIDEAEQESRFPSGGTQRFRSDASQCQEPAEPLGVLGDEGEGGDREGDGVVLRRLLVRFETWLRPVASSVPRIL